MKYGSKQQLIDFFKNIVEKLEQSEDDIRLAFEFDDPYGDYFTLISLMIR